MDFEVFEMFKLLTVASLCGMIAPVCFDFISVSLNNLGIKKNKIIQIAIDFSSVVIFVTVYILLSFYMLNGRIRGVFFISLCLGALCYFRFFSSLVKKIFGIFMYPVRIIIEFSAKNIKKAKSFFDKGIEKK